VVMFYAAVIGLLLQIAAFGVKQFQADFYIHFRAMLDFIWKNKGGMSA
jgi:hypothetical protein